MASFAGNYKSGYAHIDAFPSYNFYYVKQGKKQVYIIPHEYTCYLNMKGGIDNIYVEYDNANNNKLEWLNKVPEYYNFELETGDVLIFNNSKCIHKFTNLTNNNIIYTIRLYNTDVSTLILKNDILHYEQAYEFSNIILNGEIIKNTSEI